MPQDDKDLTWKQKLENGVPLNHLDEVKADADFNYNQRLREEQARKDFEALKQSGHLPRASAEKSATEVSGEKGGK